MSGWMRFLGWTVATLVIAAIVHIGTVYALPHLIMNRTLAATTRMRGYNVLLHGKRPTAASRGAVRPSPDLLYSTCPYDLAAAHDALRVTATVPQGTYWSVSLFDDNTNNFFVINDRQAKDGRVDFVIVPAMPIDLPRDAPRQIVSPSNRGLILFRTLINDESRLKDIDAARRKAACVPYDRAG
jgi:uncharacterized membrane protein